MVCQRNQPAPLFHFKFEYCWLNSCKGLATKIWLLTPTSLLAQAAHRIKCIRRWEMKPIQYMVKQDQSERGTWWVFFRNHNFSVKRLSVELLNILNCHWYCEKSDVVQLTFRPWAQKGMALFCPKHGGYGPAVDLLGLEFYKYVI